MSIWSNLGLVYALLGAAVAVFLAGCRFCISELVSQVRQHPEL